MKGFISFAIVCFLVYVQVSARFPNDLEQYSNTMGAEQLLSLEDSDATADVSDEMSSKNAADDITIALDLMEVALKIETIDDLLRFQHNFKKLFNLSCRNNTCVICYTFICLRVTYVEPRRIFQVCVLYNSIPIYCKSIPAQGFRICMRVPFVHIKACVAILNMRISDGRACLDLQLSAESFIYTFRNLCVGTSHLE
ncbi:hypothetical protein CHS0354_027754 [Potamilus streckersoni]|uniref:Uncharacterized protein n=1 Tax=Potamilus streckersoni TaxID=2493646 RepID=A0AAE0T344_9BIVA|nr:hypothetical protein CHS0354_027754 [Potamilus streckersoni]